MTSLVSGSPVIQNGKLIGAVTHVFVNDPTRDTAYLLRICYLKQRKPNKQQCSPIQYGRALLFEEKLFFYMKSCTTTGVDNEVTEFEVFFM